MEHIAQTFEHIVLKADPWELIDLNPSWHIATIKEFDVYTDRAEAIAAIKAVYPDFEPPEWDAPQVPDTVTMRQGRLALLAAGYLDSVTAAIDSIPDPEQKQAAKIEWEYATVIDRNSVLTKTIQHVIGMTDGEVDALFIKAATL